jgi:RNA polymerase sigma-70 factor (ECF subfamily)
MDEVKIMELLFARSERAVTELELQYGRLIRDIISHILHNQEDEAECVNDTWMAVWNAIPPQRPHSLISYVCRVAKNLALHRYRDDHRQKRSAMLVALSELEECLEGGNVEDEVLRRELIRGINGFLGQLSEDNRNIWVLHYWMGATPGEIAAKTGMGKNTIAIRLTRMRKGLRSYLEQEELI